MDEKEEPQQKQKKRRYLTIRALTKTFIRRQDKKNADTFIIIYGLTRTGKTVLGFRFLLYYFYYMRKLFKAGRVTWDPPHSWRFLFKNFFSMTAEEMNLKIKRNPEGSFNFIDEGVDVLSWQHQLENEQKELVAILQKSGKKKQFTILITPNLSLLTKNILSRARYMMIITGEPDRKRGNYALVLKNSNNPILAENNPFGIKKIIKDILKYPRLAENFESYVRSKREYCGRIYFHDVKPELYALYEKIVKDPSINREKDLSKVISYDKYKRLKYALETLVYNLKIKDLKSVKQIQNLLRDKFGQDILNNIAIREYIAKIENMTAKTDPESEELERDLGLIKEGDGAAVDLDLTFEDIESGLNAESQGDEHKKPGDPGEEIIERGPDDTSGGVDTKRNSHRRDRDGEEDDGRDDGPGDD
jgi:hypothetical protein